ncbi:MAG: 2-dehydropantoate 2-reductase N-terminal domain-containing protein [Clostridiales bacterium]|nr:2-dehydropantoate 2-reductase N-terminal domain-containing protein [Clostridiales bacterium]
MRILIYGAGVIGCLYATLFCEAGYDTTVYARGKRLNTFREKGLLYFKDKQVKKANVSIIDKVEKNDLYDFIFLTVKENQVHEALEELENNASPNIVTMVNTLESYDLWEKICGVGRVIPAFPGAGGSFEGDVLHAALTPWIIQPTTFGEINRKKSERLLKLKSIFKQSHIPYQIVTDMHDWQLCHLAMVVPIADAYYETEHPENAGSEKALMVKTAQRMKRNFCTLHETGITLSPKKMNLFRLLPVWVLSIGLGFVFRSDFGNIFMYRHSMNAPDEMRQLHQQFYGYLKEKRR